LKLLRNDISSPITEKKYLAKLCMSKKDKANLLAIIDSIDKILTYLQDIDNAVQFYKNSVVFDATLMNFVAIGEMVERLSTSLRETRTRYGLAED
jgi:uncharacterized protein with HEPN domain